MTREELNNWTIKNIAKGFNYTCEAELIEIINEKREMLKGKVYKYAAFSNSKKLCPQCKESVSDCKSCNSEKKCPTCKEGRTCPHIIDYEIQNLNNSVVHLSQYFIFNDPFDGYLGLKATDNYYQRRLTEVTKKKDKRFLEDFIKRFGKQKNKLIADIKKGLEIYYATCFSADFDNQLMWAHYANKHTGFCIEYDIRNNDNKQFVTSLWPVIYTDERPEFEDSVYEYYDETLPRRPSREEVINNNDVFMQKLLLTKSIDWERENEWRLIVDDENFPEFDKNTGNFKLNNGVTKIILGCKSKEVNVNKMREFCKNSKIKLSKMKMDNDNYDLKEETIIS